MDYTGHSPEQVRKMLAAMGKSRVEDLFKDIPDQVRLKHPLNIPSGTTELEAGRRFMSRLSGNTVKPSESACFLGAGAYYHFIPSVIDALVSRGEFLTAYTPYQAEMSQGLLQSIFEFQQMSANLLGMEVSNASLYDGAHAIVEAVTMAVNSTGRHGIIVPETLNPQYSEVLRTYNVSGKFDIIELPCPKGVIGKDALTKAVNESTAAVVLQFPNYFGCLEDVRAAADIVHAKGGLLITSFYPIATGLFKPPGENGADIATAEGQPLGNPLNFGGPYLGILATRKRLIHSMPGRIVGRTVDMEGKEAFVLTLQAREQHIKREKASSNICSNQALAALRAGIYLSLMGAEGLRKTAILCRTKAERLVKGLVSTSKAELLFEQPFFNEFTLKFREQKTLENFISASEKKNLFPGVRPKTRPDCLVVCATEMNTDSQIEEFIRIAGGSDV